MERTRTAAGALVAVLAVTAALTAVLVVTGVFAVPTGNNLVVDDDQTGERYLSVPVEDGTTVALEYTHSVEKSRVYEQYTVRGDRLEMTRMEFESYGWGLPADANVTLENGTFVYDPERNVSELTVKPGRIAGHRLHVGNRTYDLVERSEARSVRISLAERSTTATLERVSVL